MTYDENTPMSLKDFLKKSLEAVEFDIQVDQKIEDWEKYQLHGIVWQKLFDCINIVERMMH